MIAFSQNPKQTSNMSMVYFCIFLCNLQLQILFDYLVQLLVADTNFRINITFGII
jgi:hypothetical protein